MTRMAVRPLGSDLETHLGEHLVQLYDREEELAETAGAYLADALGAGATIIVVAGEAHMAGLAGRVAASGIDVEAAREQGRLVELDAGEMLAGFLVDGRPDAWLFDAVIGRRVRAAAGHGRPLTIFGEMVALLWDADNVG